VSAATATATPLVSTCPHLVQSTEVATLSQGGIIAYKLLASTWPHLNSDVTLEEGKLIELSLCYSIV